MFLEQGCDRNFDAFSLIYRLLEFWCFSDLQTNEEANTNQKSTGDERNTPAKRHELFFSQQLSKDQEDACCENEADRCAKLREHAVPSALAFRRIFSREQNSTAPFATKTKALTQTAESKQQSCPYADGFVSWQEADCDCGNTHGHECCHERRLTADLIAEMAKQRAADRTCEEGNCECCQRLEQRGVAVTCREEKVRENDYRSGGINIKVKKFDCCADHARGQNAARRIFLRNNCLSDSH